MKKMITGAILLFACISANAQKIGAYSADQLMQRVGKNDTAYIVNFWATWCIPCVKELPAFDSLQRHYAGKPVKVLLVSMDFPEEYQKKIALFVKKRKPLPEIVWLKETNANEFIPKIDSRWSGALPGTLIIKGSNREFLEKMIHTGDIIPVVDNWLK